MKITKPSQLREGTKLKGKYIGIPISGYAAHTKHGTWCIIPQAIAFASDVSDEIYYQFTDVESVEGIRAAKEGDMLVDEGGGWKTVLFANDHIAILSCYVDPATADKSIYTWEELEKDGWKLKDEPSTEADPIEVNGKEIEQRVFAEIEKELFKHKFNTDMDGWQIVPQLMATMQILRKKYFGENQEQPSEKYAPDSSYIGVAGAEMTIKVNGKTYELDKAVKKIEELEPID